MSEARIPGLVERIEAGQRRLEELAAAGAERLARSYAPGKWNGVELLAHLADADLVYHYRIAKVIAEEGQPIVPFDQDRWIVELHASRRPVEVSLAACRAARLCVTHLLRSMPSAVWRRQAFHPEAGNLSALDLAQRMADHALHHAGQLQAIRDGRNWEPARG